MITGENFIVEPWHIRETALDLSLLDESESLFALSNGHIGLRGGRARSTGDLLANRGLAHGNARVTRIDA